MISADVAIKGVRLIGSSPAAAIAASVLAVAFWAVLYVLGRFIANRTVIRRGADAYVTAVTLAVLALVGAGASIVAMAVSDTVREQNTTSSNMETIESGYGISGLKASDSDAPIVAGVIGTGDNPVAVTFVSNRALVHGEVVVRNGRVTLYTGSGATKTEFVRSASGYGYSNAAVKGAADSSASRSAE